ncbi:MAG: OmpA family protein [Candidatus Kapaibacterium sp.]
MLLLRRLFISALLCSATSLSVFAQEYRWGAGLHGGATIAVTEGSEVNPSWGVRGFLRYALLEQLHAEIGAGFMSYVDKQEDLNLLNVQGTAIPIDLRFNITPWANNTFSPYAVVGAGLILYNADTADGKTTFPLLAPREELSGSYFAIPVGVGANFKLSKNFALELQGVNYLGLNDALNPNLDDKNDGLWNIMAGFVYAFGEGGETDTDGDLLTDKYEQSIGTDPNNPDTDGDGLTDGAEVNSHRTDPLKRDTDGDSLTDGAEVNTHGTNPLEKDTDGDSLTDGAEINQHKTNPLNRDTDGEGLSDGDEVNRYRTDPTKADTDGDTLNDAEELDRYKTDPLKVDSDTDGLTDGAEVTTHLTNPNDRDSDKDGLTDGDEVNKYRTNPNKGDTDDGGISDGAEVNQKKTNPLDGSDDVLVERTETRTVVEREVVTNNVFDTDKPLVLKGIVFETGKWEIKPESERVLNEVLVSLRDDNPDVRVEIGGHTDNVGSDQNNQTLSLNRANSVKQWLVDHGIAASRIETKGYGEIQPTATNDTPEGRQENRRIEMRKIN